jgi:two-component system, OmpR family, alkaline phosphatase synthesis response regulator PhoP
MAFDDEGSDSGSGELKLGNVNVDLATFKVTVGSNPANLTYQEFELLRYLADFRDRVVSFDVLSGLLWGSTGPKETRRLNVLVCRLRSKLRNSFPYRLETVRGRGYGLLGGGGEPAQGRGGGAS